MNQREATVTIIDFVKEQAPEDPRVVKALKVLEKRCEVLRLRHERRFAVIPEDLESEPLTMTEDEIRDWFYFNVCQCCGKRKPAQVAFCEKCFYSLDAGLRKGFGSWLTLPWAYCRAVRMLNPNSIAVRVKELKERQRLEALRQAQGDSKGGAA